MLTYSTEQTTVDPSDPAIVGECALSASRPLRTGLVERLAARLRAAGLDRALASGVDPTGSPRLAARTVALTSTCGRSRMAEQLGRLVSTADRPHGAWAIPPNRPAVTANSAAISDLAELLKGRSPLYVRGLAALSQLLRDGTGPVYTGDAASLSASLSTARSALLDDRAPG